MILPTSNLWGRFCDWVTSTENRLYIGWFGVLMIPTILNAMRGGWFSGKVLMLTEEAALVAYDELLNDDGFSLLPCGLLA
jgi:hypothetical protein